MSVGCVRICDRKFSHPLCLTLSPSISLLSIIQHPDHHGKFLSEIQFGIIGNIRQNSQVFTILRNFPIQNQNTAHCLSRVVFKRSFLSLSLCVLDHFSEKTHFFSKNRCDFFFNLRIICAKITTTHCCRHNEAKEQEKDHKTRSSKLIEKNKKARSER